MQAPHGLDTDTQVFFYENEFYALSNFSPFRLRWMGHDFDTSEHAYQYAKFDAPNGANTFHRKLARDTIRLARSAHEAFRYARDHADLVREDWSEKRLDIMLDILRCKVDQHEYVRSLLLRTGDRQIIENSWRDDFWGWGPNRDGKNMLGNLWMMIRNEVRAAQRAG